VGSITENSRFVYFGTGNKDYPVTDNGTGKFYGIRDSDTDNTTVSEASLVGLISGSTNLIDSTAGFTGTIQYGWVLNLGSINSTTGVDTSTHSGEKVLSDPVVFNNNVYFTTYTPTTTGICTGGGVSRLYGLNYITGGAAMAAITSLGETAGATVSRHAFTTLGVASSPTLSINPSGQSSLFVGFSGVAGGTGSYREITIDSPPKMKNIKSWKEIL
jgi:Tfp pilus tip-associated adhesin PilY1